ncbi:MAG: cytochrome c biogenesis protein CcsA [Planctomycetales bacterium]
MENVTVVCFLASYAVALALELVRLVKRVPVRRAVMLLFAAAGFVAHTTYLVVRSRQTELPPLLSSTQDWMLVLAWLALVFYLVLTLVDRDLAVGLFLLPLVLVLIGASYFVSGEPNALVAGSNGAGAAEGVVRRWALLHAALLVFGIGGVMLGFVSSLMYLVQHRRLKQQQTLLAGLQLPSLERLARLNWWAVIVSVPLLTLGMGTGIGLALYSRRAFATVSLADPVIVANGVLWLVMVAFFVWLLRTERPAGKQVAWLTIWAFGFLVLTLFGTELLPTWHAAAKEISVRE